jgi:branched-chain amino acid transport system substrate-binding protein
VEYYISTKAALLALRAVGGDLSDGHARLRATLDELAFDTPTGPTWLNKNRQAAVTVFVNEVVIASRSMSCRAYR